MPKVNTLSMQLGLINFLVLDHQIRTVRHLECCEAGHNSESTNVNFTMES